VNFPASHAFCTDLSIGYSPKFYSSPQSPGVREGKLEKLQSITVSRGQITSTVMEEKREPEEKERESKRAQKRKSHDIIT
jgi:hypothetical protein